MKKIICMMGVLVLISTALVGCGKSKSNTSSDKPYGAGVTSKKVSSTATNSTSGSSSDNHSSQVNVNNLDDKTIGLLAYEWTRDEQSKSLGKKTNFDQYSHYNTVIKSKFLGNDDGNTDDYYLSRICYNGTKSNGYSSLTLNGDGLADLQFDVDGSNVKLQYLDSSHLGNGPVSQAPKVNKTVSVLSLVKTYYNTVVQKKHVDNFAKSILSESEWTKEYNENND
ncbi:hypothetical protein LNP16_05180 [Apilactobacillus kunkeei]|uniref:Lreu_0056 family protein n=1 Tax=Apilactobacillus kunkeei TaxID=148814 RepID=UPI00200A97EA|nr:hypothetical protein [Apilactobacillus kunkeei]MCK8634433.1 hypothetical protein [Apilactobacillus kunkeei]